MQIAIDSAIFPEGTSGRQLDVLARKALWKDGMNYMVRLLSIQITQNAKQKLTFQLAWTAWNRSWIRCFLERA